MGRNFFGDRSPPPLIRGEQDSARGKVKRSAPRSFILFCFRILSRRNLHSPISAVAVVKWAELRYCYLASSYLYYTTELCKSQEQNRRILQNAKKSFRMEKALRKVRGAREHRHGELVAPCGSAPSRRAEIARGIGSALHLRVLNANFI